MANNKEIAQKVLEAVGGKDNVTHVTHCMTRLRFNLKDQGIPVDEEVKKINGVLGVVASGGQYQIVIGQNVGKVYAEVCKIGGFEVKAAVEENPDGVKEKLTPKKIGSSILNYVGGSMIPMIPAMLGTGLCKALMALIGPNMLNLVGESNGIYIMLNLMYDGFFYFLPIMVGFNAAKKLKIPVHLGSFMGAVLLAPAFVQMAADGTAFDILGIPVTVLNYSQSVVPVLLSVAFMGVVYKGMARIMPDTLTTIFTPFLTMLITVPVSLIALAPLGNNIANLISGGIAAFGNLGFIGSAFIGAIWEFLVMTGMHTPVIMTFLVDAAAKGYMDGAAVAPNAATWACWGVALGAFLRFRNRNDKSSAGGFFISGMFGGVTEPILYGLCMKYRRCFLTLIIGGAVGGAYLGLTGVQQYVMAAISNFLNALGFAGGTTANMVNGIVGCVLALVSAAVATYLIGFSKEELEQKGEE